MFELRTNNKKYTKSKSCSIYEIGRQRHLTALMPNINKLYAKVRFMSNKSSTIVFAVTTLIHI